MKNPFETGYIRNYILFYVGIVVLMILFFIISTIYRDDKVIPKKVFNTEIISPELSESKTKKVEKSSLTSKVKLLDKVYQ